MRILGKVRYMGDLAGRRSSRLTSADDVSVGNLEAREEIGVATCQSKFLGLRRCCCELLLCMSC